MDDKVMLIAPNGIEEVICDIQWARIWVRAHKGWRWRRLNENEKEKAG
jgi:hypothetical protein